MAKRTVYTLSMVQTPKRQTQTIFHRTNPSFYRSNAVQKKYRRLRHQDVPLSLRAKRLLLAKVAVSSSPEPRQTDGSGILAMDAGSPGRPYDHRLSDCIE